MRKITIHMVSGFQINIFRGNEYSIEEIELEFSGIGDKDVKSLTFKDDDGESSTTLVNAQISHYRIEK